MRIVFLLHCASFTGFVFGKAVSSSIHESPLAASRKLGITTPTEIVSASTSSTSNALPSNTSQPALTNGGMDIPDPNYGTPAGWNMLNYGAFAHFISNDAALSPPTYFAVTANSPYHDSGPVRHGVVGVYHDVSLKAGTTYAISYYVQNSGALSGNITLSMTRSGDVVQQSTYSNTVTAIYAVPVYVLQGPFLYKPDAALADANGDITEVLQLAVLYPLPHDYLGTELYFDSFSVEAVA